MRHHFVVMLREGAGREASPAAAITDAQSVKATVNGGPCGWDAAKRPKGSGRVADRCATSRWILRACCWAWSCTRPTSRMPMASEVC